MLPASLPRPVPCHLATSCDSNSNSNRNFILSRPRLVVSDKLSDSYYYDLDTPDFSSSPSDTLDDDSLPSPPPLTAQEHNSPNYHYNVNCGPVSFGSPSESSTDMYKSDPPSAYTITSSPSNIYNHPPRSIPSDYSIGTVTDIRESDPPPSDPPASSPSPVDVHSSATIFYSPSGPPFSSSFPTDPDHNLSHNSQLLPERDPTNNPSSSSSISAPQTHSSILDRRMSEPALLTSPNPYSVDDSTSSPSRYPNSSIPYNSTSRSAYLPSLHRGSSIGSLRELRQLDSESRATASFHTGDALDSPLSPFQSGFTGGSPLVPYSIPEDQYGTSPSETGFPSPGAEANLATHPGDRQGRTRSSTDPTSKTYSFVALPGNAVKKRPRRRYDEIERLYQCSWPDCNKSYGTLNHLNAHVTMQKHGQKRSPNEFKELRKQWRKAKKEAEAAVNAAARRSSMGSVLSDEQEFYDTHHYSSPQQRFSFPGAHNLPSSIAISSRYGISSTEDYYTTADRTDRGVDYTSLAARPRYGESSGSSPWNHSSISSSRSSLPYISSSLPSQSSVHPYHYGSHNHGLQSIEPPFQSGLSDRSLSIPSPPQMVAGRLPPNSTLLTPLPGYESRETLPPLQMGGDMTYEPGAYYDEDSGRRSGPGHASAGRARGGDY